MNSRERVNKALDFQAPDIVPVECHPSPAGLYEHGMDLKQLWAEYPQDFGDLVNLPVPKPEPGEIQEDGSFRRVRRDIWGVLWDEAIFGVCGHPIERPLDDLSKIYEYVIPTPPEIAGAAFDEDRKKAQNHMQKHFLKSGWISVFEVLHAVRKFEDVLVDITLDTPEINCIADMVCRYQGKVISHILARGADAVQFGDDFGTQTGMIISPAAWRTFFKPRYKELIAPIKKAGVKVFFHSCGMVWDLLEDFADIGVDAIWPQMKVYDMPALAKHCRELKLAVALHPDRSHIMTTGTPQDIDVEIRNIVDVFKPHEGGSWFYIEIDNGFPYENVKALFESIWKYREII